MHRLLLVLGVWSLLSLVVGLSVARVLRGFAASEPAEAAARLAATATVTDIGSIDRSRRSQPTPAELRARARSSRRVTLVAAAVVAVMFASAAAAKGALPKDVQRATSLVAAQVGIELPGSTPGEVLGQRLGRPAAVIAASPVVAAREPHRTPGAPAPVQVSPPAASTGPTADSHGRGNANPPSSAGHDAGSHEDRPADRDADQGQPAPSQPGHDNGGSTANATADGGSTANATATAKGGSIAKATGGDTASNESHGPSDKP